MKKNFSLRKKLFLHISWVFAVFMILVLFFQYNREKNFRKRQLENNLNNICELTHKFIQANNISDNNNLLLLDSIETIIPQKNIRISIINPKGKVIYDSEVKDLKKLKNHLMRPEIQSAIGNNPGYNIRKSSSTSNSYYYYSRFYSDYYVRTAALYNIEIKNFLSVERLFIFYILLLFIIILTILFFITKKIGVTITKLKDFVIKLSLNEDNNEEIKFPNDELGEISSQMVDMYNRINIAKNDLLIEKNKLYSHLNILNEGIAFFSPSKKKILTNNHFIQFLNLISEKSTISSEMIFDVKKLKIINEFIEVQLNSDDEIDPHNLPETEIDVSKNNKYFHIKCVFFQDKSFEIIITDVSKLEKRRLIKQQMTSNIAHELKTPVATVMGYLETIQNNDVDIEKQKYFIEKAFSQARRLSELIEDISILNKIEESKEYFKFEPVIINQIINEVKENLNLKLEEHQIKVKIKISNSIIINANKSLIFSIFYNLFDNAIKYGGKNIEICINNYLIDKSYYYFSFSNTGNNIEEKHLSRIFERFYRLDTGRSRKSGGTGLGLAIVKNAIQLHDGEITARKFKDKGVEFIFSLEK